MLVGRFRGEVDVVAAIRGKVRIGRGGLLTILIFSGCFLAAGGTTAIGRHANRPAVVARQVEKEREKLRDVFERDLASGRAQPEDWEDRVAPLLKRAAGLSAEFRIADWNGEELDALAAIYFFAQEYQPAIEAYRKILNGRKPAERDFAQDEARLRIVRSLIELERIDEAASVFSEDRSEAVRAVQLATRIGLHYDLAIAYRDRQEFDKAARQALAGFETGRRLPPVAAMPQELRDARDFQTAKLAALTILLFERMQLKKAADDMMRRWVQFGRGRSPQADRIFETELASGRMVGTRPPQIAARTWFDSSPLTFTELRGKVVLLHFWASWNGSSTNQFERLKKWQTMYGDRGLQVIAVTRLFGRAESGEGLSPEAELRSLESFKRRIGMTFPLAVAGADDLTNDETFNIAVLPTFMLIDREGRILRVERDAVAYRKLDRYLEKLINLQ